jgi:hypothetical protein
MFAKLVQFKSSFIVVVKAIGMYLIVCCAWALGVLHYCTVVTVFLTTWTIDLAI